MAQNVELRNETCSRRKESQLQKVSANKPLEHFTEYEKQRALLRKLTPKKRRYVWEIIFKSLEWDITGMLRLGFKVSGTTS